jgi:hypothetical protein
LDADEFGPAIRLALRIKANLDGFPSAVEQCIK